MFSVLTLGPIGYCYFANQQKTKLAINAAVMNTEGVDAVSFVLEVKQLPNQPCSSGVLVFFVRVTVNKYIVNVFIFMFFLNDLLF